MCNAKCDACFEYEIVQYGHAISLSSYRIRFAKFSQNLNRTKLIPHWSAWRRLRRRALSSYSSRDLLLYSAKDKLILLSDLFRAKYANDLSDISHPYEYS